MNSRIFLFVCVERIKTFCFFFFCYNSKFGVQTKATTIIFMQYVDKVLSSKEQQPKKPKEKNINATSVPHVETQ